MLSLKVTGSWIVIRNFITACPVFDVYELIRPKPDGSGLIRTFRLPELNEDLWFVFSPIDGVVYEASHGKEESGKIKFPAGNNREFTIIMTKAKGK